MVRLWISIAVLLAACVLVVTGARASVEAESGYTKAQTYNAALRYLRVDLGYEVTEKDPEAAYLLFKLAPEGKKAQLSGSFEIVEQKDAVRVYVRLPELPQYREAVLSEGLLKKLRTEYGEPPRRPAKKDRAESAPDGGR